jgi:hypothetical protein
MRSADHTFDTVADANAWLSTQHTAVINHSWRPPEPARELFGPYAEAWLKLGVGRKGEVLSPRTVELYDGLWKRWLKDAFAERPMGDIQLETVRTWLSGARKANSGSTQPEKAYRLLRCVLNVAVDDGKIISNPCRISGAGKENPDERPIVDMETALELVDAVGDRYGAMVFWLPGARCASASWRASGASVSTCSTGPSTWPSRPSSSRAGR